MHERAAVVAPDFYEPFTMVSALIVEREGEDPAAVEGHHDVIEVAWEFSGGEEFEAAERMKRRGFEPLPQRLEGWVDCRPSIARQYLPDLTRLGLLEAIDSRLDGIRRRRLNDLHKDHTDDESQSPDDCDRSQRHQPLDEESDKIITTAFSELLFSGTAGRRFFEMKGFRAWFVALMISGVGLGCSHEGGQESSPVGAEAHTDRGDSSTPDGSKVGPTQAVEAPPAIEIPDDLPWNDPRAMAIEALNRCKSSDVVSVLAVSTKVNRGHEITSTAGQSACASIFGNESWRTKAVQAWTGDVKAVRLRYEEAWALFQELPDGDAAVVVLKREDDRWRLHDLFNTPVKRFEVWGRPLESM